MILKTKYFDIETDQFSFKNPEVIKQRLEEKYCNYFTDEPYNEAFIYNGLLKIHLKYKHTDDFFPNIEFGFSTKDLLFSDVGHIEGYKITNLGYTCRGFKYELNHTYSMEEDPIPCKKGFHFCKELTDCFNYYPPASRIFAYNLDNLKFLKAKSNGTTYKLRDKYCTNNITILEECTTEEILEAFKEWIRKRANGDYFRVKLRNELYEYYNDHFIKVWRKNFKQLTN